MVDGKERDPLGFPADLRQQRPTQHREDGEGEGEGPGGEHRDQPTAGDRQDQRSDDRQAAASQEEETIADAIGHSGEGKPDAEQGESWE